MWGHRGWHEWTTAAPREDEIMGTIRGVCAQLGLNWDAAILQFISISVHFIDEKVFVTVIVNNLFFSDENKTITK